MLVAERAQLRRGTPAEVVVAALPLDRLEDEGGDVVGVFREGLLDLRERELLEGRSSRGTPA